jgi:hypothetical protein
VIFSCLCCVSFFGGVRKTLSRDSGCVGYNAVAVFSQQGCMIVGENCKGEKVMECPFKEASVAFA